MTKTRRFTFSCLSIVAILALWTLASKLAWVNPFLLPPPSRVWTSFQTLLNNGKLLDHSLVSLARVGAGYGLAVLLSFALSLALLSSKTFAALIETPLEFLRQIPPLAIVPLSMLWLGIGEGQKTAVILLGCFFPIFLGFRGGFAQVDPKLLEVGRAAGFSKLEILRRIAIPAALPSMIVGLRLGLGYGWRALVGAELIASSAGLGYMILDAQDLARTDIMLVGVFTIGTIGLLIDAGLKALVRWRMPWIREELELGRRG